MCNKYIFETVNRCFKDIMKVEGNGAENKLFSGKVIVLSGDFRHVLLVIPRCTRTDIVTSTLKRSYIWPFVDVKRLTINMRSLIGSCEDKEIQQDFVNYLLRIGNGTETTVKLKYDNTDSNLIEIKNSMLSKSTNLDGFIDEVYQNISNITQDINYVTERTILTDKNEDVDIINDKVLNKINEKEFVYYSLW